MAARDWNVHLPPTIWQWGLTKTMLIYFSLCDPISCVGLSSSYSRCFHHLWDSSTLKYTDIQYTDIRISVLPVGALSQYNSQSMARREVFQMPTEVSTRTNVSHTMINDPYFSGTSDASALLETPIKHVHSLMPPALSSQTGWWWPRSTQRPAAWWRVKSPRRWFRGASWEEPLSQRRCFMNLKLSF